MKTYPLTKPELTFYCVGGLFTIICCVLLGIGILWAPLHEDNREIGNTNKPMVSIEREATFFLESEGEKLGNTEFYVIKHKNTGAQFIVTKDKNGTTVSPLTSK